MKTKINTHRTSHCQDVLGYVQKTIFRAAFEMKLILDVAPRQNKAIAVPDYTAINQLL
jgi:hypothetical protein